MIYHDMILSYLIYSNRKQSNNLEWRSIDWFLYQWNIELTLVEVKSSKKFFWSFQFITKIFLQTLKEKIIWKSCHSFLTYQPHNVKNYQWIPNDHSVTDTVKHFVIACYHFKNTILINDNHVTISFHYRNW